MRVVIADDEAAARERLRQMLEAHSGVAVVGEATNGLEAMTLATELAPDLLVLDIQMPGCTGLDVAASLPAPRPAIVFCTAFDQHAIEGFELNALDYLLKPVTRARLAQTLSRVSERGTQGPRGAESHTEADSGEDALDRAARARDEKLTRFLVRNGSRYTVVAAQRVLYLESVDGLTRLTVEGAPQAWLDPPLNDLEVRLDPARFFRISRAAIVNLQAVAELHRMPGGSAELALKNGDRLEVSRRRLRELLQALERA